MRRLDTNGYCALGIPFYVALIASEYFVARRRGRRATGLPTPSATSRRGAVRR
jgi:hypothetical protein